MTLDSINILGKMIPVFLQASDLGDSFANSNVGVW